MHSLTSLTHRWNVCLLQYLLCNVSHFKLNFKSTTTPFFVCMSTPARGFQFKIQFLHPWSLWNPIYFVRMFSRGETNLLHVDFMQHNGTFSPSKISHIEQKKGLKLHLDSHRFINYGAFSFHASSTDILLLLWYVAFGICRLNLNCFSNFFLHIHFYSGVIWRFCFGVNSYNDPKKIKNKIQQTPINFLVRFRCNLQS